MLTIDLTPPGSDRPPGKPVKSEWMNDGRRRHTLPDGRRFTVGRSRYRLDYLATWAGAQPGETFAVRISIAGLAADPLYFEAWNHDLNELGRYAFHKAACITDVASGESITGEELRVQMGGAVLPTLQL